MHRPVPPWPKLRPEKENQTLKGGRRGVALKTAPASPAASEFL